MAVLVVDRARPNGGLVRTITLARPERRNALDAEHLEALRKAVEDAGRSESVRVVIIAGQGKAFCAGYDLSQPIASADGSPDSAVLETMAAVQRCPVPVIARVHGPAFGAGLHLAIACDLRIASEAASFCLPAAKLGIAYAPVGIARLISLVGTSTARRLVFAAEVLDATDATSLRLVDELVPSAELDACVEALANAIAGGAPLAIRAMKRTFNAMEAGLSPELALEAERDRLGCFTSDDAAEGAASFVEKRPAVFRGR